MQRLQKVLAAAGVASRRKAEEYIAEGRVTVNGEVITQMGFQVSPEDEILVDGQPIRREEKVYFLLNKPKRTLSAVSDDRERRTVVDCLQGVDARVFPVGRLDYDTTGLLILTNDGEFANKMMHPSSHLPKTYEVTLEGIITENMVRMMERGIMLDDGRTLPAEVYVTQQSVKKNRTVLLITIFEGRNRQVRRMMEYFHCEVKALNRIGYGFLEIGNLQPGQYRRLRMYEVRKLMQMADDQSAAAENSRR
jgi:23S rRNA pseudouridine2605 synthase